MTYQDNLQAFFHDHGQIEHKPSLNKPHIDFEPHIDLKDSQEKTLYKPKPPKQCMKNGKKTKQKTKQNKNTKTKKQKKLVIALNIQLVITNYLHHKHLITDNC